MSEITVFHGSEYIIPKPEYGKGNIHNDYGPGFYCTEHIEMAREWACTKKHGGYANQYLLHTDGLSVMRLNSGSYHILNWLAILVENRTFSLQSDLKRAARDYLLSNFLPDYKGFDVIIGYRADDSYFSFANTFLGNGLSLMQLDQVMHLGNLGEQVVIRSRKAFHRLTYLGYEIAEQEVYYKKKQIRDDKARDAYRKERDQVTEGIYMIDVMRRGWRNEDVRL